MTYRSIFVHVDDSAPCAGRLEVATRVARAYPARLLGAYLVPSANVMPFASVMLPEEVVQRRLQENSDLQHDAEARFRAAATQAGVTSVDWHAPAGNPLEAAILHARYADLAVVGQPSRDEPNLAFATELANAVIMGSGRPVLFVPYTGQFKTVGERIMIAWKDSRESARAVADALPFLKQAKQVLALAVQPREEETLHDHLADRAVKAFLDRHEIAASVQRTVAPDISAGEDLLSRAADFGADLIVMGGYSRPRLARWVWGGVSNTMLESMTVPVLMSH